MGYRYKEEWYHESSFYRTFRIFKSVSAFSTDPKFKDSSIHGPFDSFWSAKDHAVRIHKHNMLQMKRAVEETRAISLDSAKQVEEDMVPKEADVTSERDVTPAQQMSLLDHESNTNEGEVHALSIN